MKISITNILLMALALTIMSCQKDSGVSDIDINPNEDLPYGLGADGNEDNSNVPSNIYLGNGTLPGSHDLTQYAPPIGDQGNYGTCVAWALGYNLKTMLEAIDKNYSSQDLNESGKQFSAKDLFLSIPNSQKGANCEGTQLYYALDVIQDRGIATMSTAPYQNLGDCSQAAPSNWANEASNYKIQSYRKINITVDEIKQNIANNRPVGFGAKLGDNFFTWKSDDVITGHTSFDRTGIHSYHAMAVVGYDDNKGPNGAFRIVNSWGDDWGDFGFIWIDYNFFCYGDFGYTAYVATNASSDVDPNDPTDPTSEGNVDLVPWGLSDDFDPNGSSNQERELSYNVYNVGSETAKASDDWGIGYIYYNAFDASDYGLILYDHYSDDFGSRGDNGRMDNGPASDNWWNHVDVVGGSSCSQAVFGSQDNFSWGYNMPRITGYYYLVMIADVFDAIEEMDESNNYFYFTDQDGYPIWFENGIPSGFDKGGNQMRSSSPSEPTFEQQAPSQRSKEMANAYTKSEITNMLIHMKDNGKLKAAATQARSLKSSERASK